jgi:septal ring factor EnvC (AmiA/AmiB activator)
MSTRQKKPSNSRDAETSSELDEYSISSVEEEEESRPLVPRLRRKSRDDKKTESKPSDAKSSLRKELAQMHQDINELKDIKRNIKATLVDQSAKRKHYVQKIMAMDEEAAKMKEDYEDIDKDIKGLEQAIREKIKS